MKRDTTALVNEGVTLVMERLRALAAKDGLSEDEARLYQAMTTMLGAVHRVEASRLTFLAALLTGREKVSERMSEHDLALLLRAVSGEEADRGKEGE